MTEDTTQVDELEEEVIITEESTEEITQEPENTEELALDQEKEDTPEVETEHKQSRNQNAKQRLRRKNRELEAENERLRLQQERFDALETKVDSVVNPPKARPSRVDFETEEDYEDSLFDWRDSRNQPAPVIPEPAQTQSQNKRSAVSQEVLDNWDNQFDDMTEKHDDFEQVVKDETIPITDTMSLAIMESKKAGEIAYFLGKNHGEAQRISRLGLTAQVREIDKLGAKFKTTTSTPDPIKTVNHKGDTSVEKIDPALNGATFT